MTFFLRRSSGFWAVVLLWTQMAFWAAPALAADDGSEAAEGRSAGASEEAEAPAEPAAAEGKFTSMEDRVPEDQQIKPGNGLDEKVSLDLRSIEVSEALRFLAVKGGLNMAISKNVSGRVQLLLNNVPIKDIFDIILITNALAMEKIGDVYYVMTELEYKERYGRKFADTRKVKIFKLRYAVPEQTFAIFEVLKSEVGRLLVDPESGTVLVMDSETNIARMEEALAALEMKRNVKIYPLKYAKAVDVESRLKNRLDNKKVGFVNADERTNSVIVETLPDRMKEIDEVVAALDEKTKEVLIEAKIVKVIMSKDNHEEISWEGLFEQTNPNGKGFIGNHGINPLFRANQSFVDDFTQIPLTARPPQGTKSAALSNLVFGNLGENSFEVLLNFLKHYGETKVLSNPKLAVINGQEAKIHVGAKQAYVTTTTTTGQTTTTTAESVTFIDIGIQLNVTPFINEDGFVTMKIKPEISSVSEFLTTPSGNKIPIVDSSLAETSVMVKDGVSVIVGGLRRDEKVVSDDKVPLLGDLPGPLAKPFHNKREQTTRTELLILITPHIVTGETLNVGEGLNQQSQNTRPGEPKFMGYEDYTPAVDVKKKAVVPPAVTS